MIVWLRDATEPGRCHGITDNEVRARNYAKTCMRNGRATTARVEQARLRIGDYWLTAHYQRTGAGWLANQGSSDPARPRARSAEVAVLGSGPTIRRLAVPT